MRIMGVFRTFRESYREKGQFLQRNSCVVSKRAPGDYLSGPTCIFSDGNSCIFSQRAPDDYLSGPATVEYLNLPPAARPLLGCWNNFSGMYMVSLFFVVVSVNG